MVFLLYYDYWPQEVGGRLRGFCKFILKQREVVPKLIYLSLFPAIRTLKRRQHHSTALIATEKRAYSVFVSIKGLRHAYLLFPPSSCLTSD